MDDPETNRRFAESLGLDYPILSDPAKTTARAYGVVGHGPFAKRRTFYIGKDGRILDIDTAVTPATAGTEIAARLERLRVPLR